MLVDARILLDVEVLRRHVGFGLIVIVVGHEVLDRVVGEELAHLGIELRGERLVGCHDEGRAAEPGDDMGHGVGLARAGDPEERLEGEAIAHAGDELFDRLRLVASRGKQFVQAVRAFRKTEQSGRGTGFRRSRWHGLGCFSHRRGAKSRIFPRQCDWSPAGCNPGRRRT